MNEVLLTGSWWLLLRARGVAVVLRVLVLTSPPVAVGCTWIAAGHTVPAMNVVIVALVLVCIVLPDSHIGLLVVVLVGIEWLATVDDEASPWAVGVAASLTVFHASLAAASVTPPAARWTRAMRRRWVCRSVAVMLASSVTWAVVAVIQHLDVTGSTVLVTSSLMAAAVAGLWARDGTLVDRPAAMKK